MDRYTPSDPLGELKRQANLSPYTPDENVPSWLSALGIIAAHNPGVLALLGPKGIQVEAVKGGRLSAKPDPATVFLAGVGGCLRDSGKRIAVGSPPAARHLPLALACTALMSNTIDRLSGAANQVQGGVLVISADLELRSRYCELYVGSVLLDDVYPGSRMRPTGERIKLRPHATGTAEEGICFFLPNLTLPRKIEFKPSLIVVDMRYARWTKRAPDLSKWISEINRQAGVLVLYSVGDRDTLAALAASGFTDFPLDHGAITACTERVMKGTAPQRDLAMMDWWLASTTSFLARDHELVEIPEAQAAEELLIGIRQLVDEQRNRESPDLNRARWLLAVLGQMPVPVVWYEQAARGLGRSTLRRMINQLGVRSRDAGVGAVYQTLRMKFEQVYSQLERSNPRAEWIRAIIPQYMAENAGQRVLLLVRDQVAERALTAWLGVDAFPDADWLSWLDIVPCSRYDRSAQTQYALAVINGPIPRRYRWIGGAALGRSVKFVVYHHEMDVVEYQLQGVYGEREVAARARQREQAILAVHKSPVRRTKGSESEIPELRLKRPPKRKKPRDQNLPDRPPQVKVTSFADLALAFEEANKGEELKNEASRVASLSWEDSTDEGAPEEEFDLTPGDDDLACVRVRVQSQLVGTGYIWLSVDRYVECVRPSHQSDILRITPDKLRSGDVLLRFDEEGRTSLFERLVEIEDAQPYMQYLGTFRKRWREAIQRLAERYRTGRSVNYSRLLRDLQANGAAIETEIAVRWWVQDLVIGPERLASIQAVGRLVASDAMVKEAGSFDRAFRQIRGTHTSLGRLLNSRIRRLFHHFAGGSEAESVVRSLDQRLVLPLEELIETIDLLEVLDSPEGPSRVSPGLVGRLRSV